MNKNQFIKFLKRINACYEAVEWSENEDVELEQLWNSCPRGDWMLWLLAKLEADRKKVVLSACQCARLSLHLIDKDEKRPLEAIETAEAWCREECSLEEVSSAARAAARAARAASSASYAASYAARAAASYAAWAASYAAWAASYAASDTASDTASYAASDTAWAASYAANDAASDTASDTASYPASDTARAANDAILLQCADIVRSNFEFAYVMNLIENRTDNGD